MPFLDGIEATKAIRVLESAMTKPIALSKYTPAYWRIPIIAASASLSEQRLQEYIQAGLDGWILKPIDFQRLESVPAVRDEQVGGSVLYGSGSWEKGGCFKLKKDDTVFFFDS